MMSLHVRSAVVTALVALMLVGGCESSTLAGEKFYIDSPGVGIAYLPRSGDQVHEAALAALRDDLGYTIVSERPLVARTATDRDVRIRLSQTDDGETKMEIAMSEDTPPSVIRSIMNKIEMRLQ